MKKLNGFNNGMNTLDGVGDMKSPLLIGVIGECGKHPGNNMVNCVKCETEKQPMLNLDDLANRLDNALSKETTESLNEWLEDQYWEEVGQRCSVNTYNFWQDLKCKLKQDFILTRR